MNKVLVTGATGFIGYEVARQLVAADVDVRLMVRRPERAALVRPLRTELVSADLTRPASLARAVRGVDTVLHLGARAAFESYRKVEPTIVDGSLALMRAARDAGVERFVFASSLLVYGGHETLIDASTVATPRLDYGRAKLVAEAELERLARTTGMRFAAIRLPHVYGARDGRNRYTHLHVDDAARLMIAVARAGWTGVSPVGDDRPADWREFFAVLATHYPRFRTLYLPAWLARLGTELLRPVNSLRRRPSLYTPDTVTGWNLELAVEPGLLWQELGLRPAYPTIHEGLPAALDDCVAFRWRHPLSDPATY
jgi:nucleoside-diphosphate-sugar epimerase